MLQEFVIKHIKCAELLPDQSVMAIVMTKGFCAISQWGESFSKHLWFAIVIVYLAEMGKIPCCGRPESSSSKYLIG